MNRVSRRRRRRLALAGCVLVATVAGTTPATSAGRAAAFAASAEADVHPGVLLVAEGKGCTANFVFTDRAGNFYLGEAAHCTAAGDVANFDGCKDPALPLGTEVAVVAAGVTGELAYSSWATMQRLGERNEATCRNNDFALVRLPSSATSTLNPSVPHFGGPTALAPGGSTIGDLVFSYGNSPVRQGIAPLAPKYGAVAEETDEGWTHLCYFLTPVIPGDSGSAVLDEDGRAFGVASSLLLFPATGSNGIVDLTKALAYAQRHSGIKGLRLVPGTEPFRLG